MLVGHLSKNFLRAPEKAFFFFFKYSFKNLNYSALQTFAATFNMHAMSYNTKQWLLHAILLRCSMGMETHFSWDHGGE